MSSSEILDNIQTSFRHILGTKLTGIYVHGSLAMGCFRWENSDIDFLVVVREPLSQSEKEEIIAFLLTQDPYAPPKGLEMSVVMENVCDPFVYPSPFELHFSNAHKEQCQKDLVEYCRTMNGADPDLAAHFMIVRQAGQVLWGKPILEVFAPVPGEAYWYSMRSDILEAEEEILSQPVYYIMNLCRVLAYLRDRLVLSKAGGGRWGMDNCAPVYRELIHKALDTYENCVPFEEEAARLQSFAAEQLAEINQHT